MSVILKCHVYRNANIVSYTCTCNTSLVTTQFTYIVGFRVNMSKCKYLIKLTLRRTELVSQNVYHFQHCRFCCIYFGHRSLSRIPNLALFLTWSTTCVLLPTCLLGLESLQALRRTNSNAVFSLF